MNLGRLRISPVGPSGGPDVDSDSRRVRNPDTRFALALFAFLFSIYLLTFSGHYHSSDEMSMLAVSDSLARRGTLDINLYRWLGLQQGKFGPDGNLYSHKGIGTSLAALPLTWLALHHARLGNVQTALLTMSLVTALTGALLFLLVRRLGFGPAVAVGVSLLYGLATMAWVYARYLFSESLTGLTLLTAAYLLLGYRRSGRERDLFLGGLCLGITLLTRLNDALLVPLFALLLLAYARQRGVRSLRRLTGLLVRWGLPVLIALLGVGLYNLLRFGDPLDTGYLFGRREQFSTPLLSGLYGLTFSPGRGLFWYNPVLLVTVLGWPALVRRRRVEGLFAAGVVLYYLLFWSLWYLWWGGHSWGPRFLVAMLPFAVLPLAPVLDAVRHRRGAAAGLLLLSLGSVAVQLLGVAVDFNLYLEDVYARLGLYHPATLFNPAYSPLLRQWAYLRPENLDLAWARGGVVHWGGLAVGLALVFLTGSALPVAWRGRWGRGLTVGLPTALIVGAIALLLFYAPTGDVAQAAALLTAVERPGEGATLTEPLWTESWQDSYDGRLEVWGTGRNPDSVWTIGPGGPEWAAARFRMGAVRLDYGGDLFDPVRLPFPLLTPRPRLGDAVELVAAQVADEGQAGETLPLIFCWRALTPLAESFTFFVQVIDEQGVKAGQIDRLPCDGGCPTDTWQPGDLVGERYDLFLRADAPPGRYRLIVGFYDLRTGRHLLSAEGQPYLVLGSVEVRR